MDAISWKMSNNFINNGSISGLKGSTTFKHSHINWDSIIKKPKCLLLIKVEHRTFESSLAASQLVPALSAQARQPTRPQTFNGSFYQCHLIPQKVKVASVERGVVVSERKAPAAPVSESPESKQPPPPSSSSRWGRNFRDMLHVGAFAGVMNEHISKGAIILKEANTPQCGVKRRHSDKEPYPMWYLRSTSRNVHFTGMFSLANDKKKKPSLNTNSGILNRGLFVRQFNLGMKSRDIWWHSWLLLLISVGGI